MDDLRVGALVRAIRHRVGWTQRQLGVRAGVSQGLVSLLERGQLDRLTVRSVRRIAAALEIHLPFAPRWRGGDAARLLDAGHSAIVEHVVRTLRTSGWETVVEYTFNHFGERGSVDVLAWHPGRRALLIIEVKTRLLDMQAMLAILDRKVRIVPELVRRERGWSPMHLGVVIVMPGITANRSAVGGSRSDVCVVTSGALAGRPEVDSPARWPNERTLVRLGEQPRSWYGSPDQPEARAGAEVALIARRAAMTLLPDNLGIASCCVRRTRLLLTPFQGVSVSGTGLRDS